MAADDTLNVRAAPNASSADIGDLAYNASRLEVAGTDASGNWGRIVWEEGEGWISMRYLESDTVPSILGTTLPAGLTCGGTEPFWSLSMGSNTAFYTDIHDANYGLSLQATQVAEGFRTFPIIIQHTGGDAVTSTIIRPADCSDGMSDRTYPWQIDTILSTPTEKRFLSGCCHLPIESGFH